MAIDLGTANTVIFKDGEVVLDEPSIIALESKTERVVALGKSALAFFEPRIYRVRPMNGSIDGNDAVAKMLSGFIRKAVGWDRGLLFTSLTVGIGIPCGCTPEYMRSVRDLASHAGAKDIFMVYEPMALALGIGLDVLDTRGNMVVDIGAGTTEIAVISKGGIIESSTIHVAGNELNTNISDYFAQHHNVGFGYPSVEHIKLALGSALPVLPKDEDPEDEVLTGCNMVTHYPAEVTINYHEVASCLDKSVTKIESEIIKVLQRIPPELYSDIAHSGIWLAGGGSLLRGIAKRFSDKVNIPFHVAEDPLKAVARGTCIALRGADNFPFLMR